MMGAVIVFVCSFLILAVVLDVVVLADVFSLTFRSHPLYPNPQHATARADALSPFRRHLVFTIAACACSSRSCYPPACSPNP